MCTLIHINKIPFFFLFHFFSVAPFFFMFLIDYIEISSVMHTKFNKVMLNGPKNVKMVSKLFF